MSLGLRLIGQRLMIELITEENKQGNIIMVGEESNHKKGKVVATSLELNQPVCVDEIVYFDRYTGYELEFKGKEYLVLNTKDVICVETSP